MLFAPTRGANVPLQAGRSSADMLTSADKEISMSDDKNKSGGQDRERINVNQDYELRDWAKSLNTTPERVKEAVEAVGDRAEKVGEYLGPSRSR
jgi:hypothetical protein